MTTKRDGLFPPTSVGRLQGSHLQRNASHESLTAHPLLSPVAPAASPATPPAQDQPAQGSSTNPRYVPYTPRQRGAPTSATTGTTVHPPVTAAQQQPQGGATTKLQIMNLKAAAQSVGLDSGSVGWAILEKLSGENEHHTNEWHDIWSSIIAGKATLLLPLEPAASNEKITPEFVKDHIVLCDGPSRNNAPIVTLSGLRGILTDETLTIRSSLPPSSKLFQALLAQSTRSAALSSLPPLPTLPATGITYPSFSVPSYAPSLPLPPRSAVGKPPLPPRPGGRLASPTAPSRIGNPFASLFRQPAAPTSRPPSPPPPVHPDGDHILEVPAFTIDKRIQQKAVGKEIIKSLRAEIKESLSGVPSSVVEKVQNFCTALYPLIKTQKKAPPDLVSGSPPSPYAPNPQEETPEELSDQFQDLYVILEQDLWSGNSPLLGRRREEGLTEDEKDREKRSKESTDNDAHVRDIMETVERTVCSLFYDRLFMQPNSDDASHDEALTSRIAALNMLDLTLAHLDVEVGPAGTEVDAIVKACGETLTQLDVVCRYPADKAAILVAAHKLIVDGLSKLPPIRLKSEEDAKAQKTRELSPLAKEVTAVEQPQGEAPEGGKLPANSAGSVGAVSVPLMASPLSVTSLLPDSSSDLAPRASSRVDKPSLGGSGLRSRSNSPLVKVSPPASTPVSGDVLLPLIIFSVVKENPPHLVSHLLYTQRFRNQSFGGEESYCLVNLMAVAEFLENVDLGALGLGEKENKVISTADLTPIPIIRSNLPSETSTTTTEAIPASLRGRMEQQVDAFTGSANKVISGVVDTSFGVLKSLLPTGLDSAASMGNAAQPPNGWANARPGFGLLRRETGFSIASLAASLPGGRDRAKSTSSNVQEESGRQLVEVSSRPASIKSIYVDSEEEEEEDSEDDGEEEQEDEDEDEKEGEVPDARSIRSFESMMSGKHGGGRAQRKSLSDRLAHMSGLSRLSQANADARKDLPSPAVKPALLPPTTATRLDTPASSRAASPIPLRLAPPRQRFLDCSEDDLKISEVGELLREYRRLVEGVKAVGGFDD